MAKQVKHTDSRMAHLLCPSGKANITKPDASGNGLMVYVAKTGTKLWKYRFSYAGRKNDIITIGAWPLIDYEAAKAKAAWFERIRTVEQRDPKLAVYKPSKATTVDDIIRAYIETLGEETKKTVTSSFKPVRAKFGTNPVRDLTKALLLAWVDEEYAAKGNYPPRPGAAATMLRYLGAAIVDAMENKVAFDIPADFINPVVGVKKASLVIQDHQPGSHATSWEDDEFKAIMSGLKKARAGGKYHQPGVLLIELCMVTGARPSELANMQWDHVHTVTGEPDLRYIIKDKSKMWKRTKRPRRITVSKRGIEILAAARAFHDLHGLTTPYVFPPKRVQKNSKKPYFTSANSLTRGLSKDFLSFQIRPYHFRSGYINHALASHDGKVTGSEWMGLLDMVAENVGHTDSKMTMTHYAMTRRSTQNAVAKMADKAFDRFDEVEEAA